jgi:galactokinase/mevalonate kinase-like predicted kinase
MQKNLDDFGTFFTQSFEAQVTMFPRMVNDEIRSTIHQYRDRALGWKLSGAGGGGYLVLVSEDEFENALRVRIRRRSE